MVTETLPAPQQTLLSVSVDDRQIPRLLKYSSRRMASELVRINFPFARMIQDERTYAANVIPFSSAAFVRTEICSSSNLTVTAFVFRAIVLGQPLRWHKGCPKQPQSEKGIPKPITSSYTEGVSQGQPTGQQNKGSEKTWNYDHTTTDQRRSSVITLSLIHI